MTYSIKLNNRQILRGFIMSPGENVRANIIFVHGLGEHINRYVEWTGGFHELHNEPFKNDVFTYIISWINRIAS